MKVPENDSMLFTSQVSEHSADTQDVLTRRRDSLKANVKAPTTWTHMRHWF